jgi:WD40 repeat protein
MRIILLKKLKFCIFSDRTVFIWNTKDFTQKDHKSLRINIEFDHAKFIKWSPDSKAFIIHKGIENVIEVYKLTKKTDGSGFSGATKAITFPKVRNI